MHVKLNGAWLQQYIEIIQHYHEALRDQPKLANI